MAPMCMYSAQDDGMVTPFHLVHYATRATGQVGLIILEATGVVPEGRISNKDLGIWDDAHIEGLSQLVEGMKAYGAKTGIQLAHAGRKATVDGEIFAPSAIAFSSDYKTPTEMTEEDIHYVIEAFKQATIRAAKAGFDVLEIHGAHGYLISEFYHLLRINVKINMGAHRKIDIAFYVKSSMLFAVYGMVLYWYVSLRKIMRKMVQQWMTLLFLAAG